MSQADYEADGWYDIAGWGTKLSSSTEHAMTGNRSLKINYEIDETGGWMHWDFLQDEPEVYVRYYRYFPDGWFFPTGWGPHDTYLFGGDYSVPTWNNLTIYLDFWETGNTFLRVETSSQNDYEWRDLLRKHGGYNPISTAAAYNRASPDLMDRGQWHCIEFYAKISDPGVENGRLKMWVNGELVTDAIGFPFVDGDHGF